MADAPASTAGATVGAYVKATYPELAVSEYEAFRPGLFFPDGERTDRMRASDACTCRACDPKNDADLVKVIAAWRRSYMHAVDALHHYPGAFVVRREYIRAVDYWWTHQERYHERMLETMRTLAALRRARALPLLFVIRHHPVTENMHAEPVYRGVIQFL